MFDVFYNEIDSFCAEWLANLIEAGALPAGPVDTRSIANLKGADCCETSHFFAGVGGWPYALRLAGWPDNAPIWTGSCPCQPYSSAGRGKGEEDERHLWPEMCRLIRECRPPIVVGEQVDAAIRHGWLDGVFADLEREGYACGAAVLPAAGVGAPHIRHRIFWVAHTPDARCNHEGQHERGPSPLPARPKQHGIAGGMGNAGSSRIRACGRGANAGAPAGDQGTGHQRKRVRPDAGDDGSHGGMGNACLQAGRQHSGGVPGPEAASSGERLADGHLPERLANAGAGVDTGRLDNAERERAADSRQAEPGNNWQDDGVSGAASHWDGYLLIPCRDGKFRRISAQPGDEPLAHGVPSKQSDPRMGYLLAELAKLGHGPKAAKRLVREASKNRVNRIRGYGNAIVPQVAAEFIRAVMEILRGV